MTIAPHTAHVSDTEKADYFPLEAAAKIGGLLPKQSAMALEKVLKLNEKDIVSRARLLGHYWQYYDQMLAGSRNFDSELCKKRTEHILWFISNTANCVFAGDYYLSCDSKQDEVHYKAVKTAWQTQLERRPLCAQTRINFVLFILKQDQKLALEVIEETAAIQPANEWVLSLNQLLNNSIETSLPFHTAFSERPDEIFVQEKVVMAEKMLSRGTSRSPISRATVETQELILRQDEFDVWARLDILRWCKKNIERANWLGRDPVTLQRWYRHARWILHNAPQINLNTNYSPDFGFGLKLPATYFESIKETFLKACRETSYKTEVFYNAVGFFKANIGSEETKKLCFSLKEWKALDKKDRRRLTKEINWSFEPKTIFDKNISLDNESVYIDSNILLAPQRCATFSEWLDDLDLSDAHFTGYAAVDGYAANLELILQDNETDLIGTARLAGYYSKRINSLTALQISRFQNIILWMIETAPESIYASELRIYEKNSGVDVALLTDAWEKQIKLSPKNSLLAENAASWLYYGDPNRALQIAKQVLEHDPDNAFVSGLLQGLPDRMNDRKHVQNFQDLKYGDACETRIRGFKPIANVSLAKVCDDIDLNLFSILDCLRIPESTLWSNYQVLKINPNDVILRAEILSYCGRHELRRMSLIQDPKLARQRTDQILWLLENVPHADLHFFIRESDPFNLHGKILSKAVRTQRKVYGKTVAKYRPKFTHKNKND